MARDYVGEAMGELLEVARNSLTNAKPPGRVLLMPGLSVVHDDCCDGQLWVRVISLQPTTAPPLGGAPLRMCGVTGWVATVGVGIVRCAAVVDDRGRAPTPEAMTRDALTVTQDMHDLMQGLLCSDLLRSIDRWDPSGPEGGCVGGEWTATVRIPACGCPSDTGPVTH